MSLGNEDHIDIIATLHDRFSKPSDDFVRKLEDIEDQADKTGESVDDLQEKLDDESKTTEESTKAHGDNAKARRDSRKAIDDETTAVKDSTTAQRESTKETSRSAQQTAEHTKYVRDDTSALNETRRAMEGATDGTKDHTEALRKDTEATDAHTTATRKDRDATFRVTRATKDSTAAIREHADDSDHVTKSVRERTRATELDNRAWDRWNTKMKKVMGGFASRFRPIGNFFNNYFKTLGIFRGLLTSDIGAAIPQVVTGIKAIGVAAAGTLAPLGRLAGSLGQIAPLIASIGQMKAVIKLGFGGVADALKVLNDPDAKPEEIAKAMASAGQATWDFAKSLKSVQDEFKPIVFAVRESMLDGLGPAVQSLAKTYFPLLNEKLTKTASIMNGELKRGIEGLQSTERQQTIANVMERGATASGLFTKMLFSALDVLMELADAAGPSFIRTLEGINTRLETFATWIRDHKAQVTDFFDRAGISAGNFGGAIWDIGRGLYGIAKAAEPLETFLFGGTSKFLDQWADSMNDPKKQAEMTKNFEAMIPALGAIGRLLKGIWKAFGEIGSSPYFVEMIDELTTHGLPFLVDFFKGLDQNVSPALLNLGKALGGIDGENRMAFFEPLGDLLGGLAKALEVVVPLFSALPDPVQKFFFYSMGLAALGLPAFFMALLSPLNLLNLLLLKFTSKGVLGWVLEGLKKLKGLLGDLVKSPFGKWIAETFGKLKRFIEPVLKPIMELAKKWFPKIFGFLAKKVAGKGIVALIPVVGEIIGILWILWDVLSWLWKNCEPFRDFFTGIWDWIVNAWSASIGWIVNTAVPWIVGAFKSIWEGIKGVIDWIGNFYNKWIKPVIDAIVNFVKFVVVLVGTVLITPFYIFWKLIEPIVKFLVEWFKKTLPIVIEAFGRGWKITWNFIADVFGAVIDWVKGVWNGFVDFLKWGWDRIVDAWDFAWGILKGAWDMFVFTLKVVAGAALWVVDQIIKAWNWLKDTTTSVWNWIKDNVIAPVVSWLQTYVWPVISNIIDWIKDKFEGFRITTTNVWNWIKDNVIGPVVSWFMTYIWPTIAGFIDNIKGKFEWLKDRAFEVWYGIGDIISDVYHNHISPIFDALKGAVERIQDSFNTAKDVIGVAWNSIKESARGPIEFIVNKVYNEGFRVVWNKLADMVGLEDKQLPPYTFGGGMERGGTTKTKIGKATAGFAGGGVIPGYQHLKKDEVNANLRRGEGVLVPEVMKVLGAKWLNGINYLGNKRGKKGVQDHIEKMENRLYSSPAGYAGGGIVKTGGFGDAIGNAGSAVKDAASATASAIGHKVSGIGDAIANPFEGFVDEWVGKIGNSIGSTGWGGVGVGLVKTMGTNMYNFAKDKIAAMASAAWSAIQSAGSAAAGFAGNAVRGSGGKGGSLASAKALALRMGMHITSEGRRGARTAGAGLVSLHALGRAIDVAGPNMMGYFNAVASSMSPTELLYSPAGARQKNRSSGYHDTSGVTKRNHYSHVHVGFRRGGLVPINHMRFMGGPVETWGNTLIGEFGPEMFLPSHGMPEMFGLNGPEVVNFQKEGTVLPAGLTSSLASVATMERPAGDTYNVSVNVEGNGDAKEISKAVEDALKKIERQKRERK